VVQVSCSMQTDGLTDMVKLLVTFHNCFVVHRKVYDCARWREKNFGYFLWSVSLVWYPHHPTAKLAHRWSQPCVHTPCMPSWYGAKIYCKLRLFLSSTVMMVLITVICAPRWDLPIAKLISCVLSYPQYSLWINETKLPLDSSTWVSKLFTEGLMLH
jgi:hypothetical protein